MPEFFYPTRMGRVILQATEEIIGREGLHSLLALAALDADFDRNPETLPDKTFSFEKISQLMQALERAYGAQSGRGVALRVGRACFTYGLREYGSLLGITETAFRLLPLSGKFRMGARSLADLFNHHTDQRVRVEEREDNLLWHIERCPLCWERHTTEPACHLAVGLLQESLYWLSGGKTFNVEETSCVAQGSSTCTIVIDKTPIS